MRRPERELAAIRKRGAELEAIFKRLYKDSVLGSLPAGSSSPLAGSYTAEQEALKADILWREAGIQALREKVSDTDSFIARAKRYTDITELTLEQYRSPDMMEFY